jgi:hypothetical protein
MGLPEAELERLWQRLQLSAIDKMPLAEPPPRRSRFELADLVLTGIKTATATLACGYGEGRGPIPSPRRFRHRV